MGNFEEAAKFVVGTKRKCKIIRDTSVRKYDVEIKFVDGTISDVAEKIVEYVSELKLEFSNSYYLLTLEARLNF